MVLCVGCVGVGMWVVCVGVCVCVVGVCVWFACMCGVRVHMCVCMRACVWFTHEPRIITKGFAQ